jgi:uncharacterized protein YbaA (DUF1428 family)
MQVEGFAVPVLRDRIEDHVTRATDAGRVWMDHGARSVAEATADYVPDGTRTSFPVAVLPDEGGVVFFSPITFRERAHRDTLTARLMADPRTDIDRSAPHPMSSERMIWGGSVPQVRFGT